MRHGPGAPKRTCRARSFRAKRNMRRPCWAWARRPTLPLPKGRTGCRASTYRMVCRLSDPSLFAPESWGDTPSALDIAFGPAPSGASFACPCCGGARHKLDNAAPVRPELSDLPASAIIQNQSGPGGDTIPPKPPRLSRSPSAVRKPASSIFPATTTGSASSWSPVKPTSSR